MEIHFKRFFVLDLPYPDDVLNEIIPFLNRMNKMIQNKQEVNSIRVMNNKNDIAKKKILKEIYCILFY